MEIINRLLIVLIMFNFGCNRTTKNKINLKTVNANILKVDSIIKDVLIRNKNEKAINFINRIYDKKIDLNHPIIETDKWIKDTNIIFVFNNNKLNDDLGLDVEGYIYVSKNKKDYKKYIIDTYSPEGRSANIETVFFSNADNDKNKELVIICSWEQMLKKTAEGKIYETFVYDDLNIKNNKLFKLKDISNYFGIEFEGIQEGVVRKAKYKTAKDVKKELKLLGFE